MLLHIMYDAKKINIAVSDSIIFNIPYEFTEQLELIQ